MAITHVKIWAGSHPSEDKGYLLSLDSRTIQVHFEFDDWPLRVSVSQFECKTIPNGTHWLANEMTRNIEDAKHFQATLEADEGVETTGGLITLDLANVVEPNGTPGTGIYSSEKMFTVDTLRPKHRDITINDEHLTAGETATVTFVFTEKVGNFQPAIDLSKAHGTLGSLVTTDGGITWTAPFTPTPDTASTEECVISVHMNEVRDLHGNRGADIKDKDIPVNSNSYTVNTVRPTLATTGHSIDDTQLGIGQSAHVTIQFSAAVKDFDAADVVLAPGSGSVRQVLASHPAADGSSDTWEVVLDAPDTGAASTNNPISVNLAGVRTRAGSAGQGTVATGLSYSADPTRPTLEGTHITMDDKQLGIGQSAHVTIQFGAAVKDFDAADVVLAPGSGSVRQVLASHPAADGSSDTWEVVLDAPDTGAASTNNPISVNLAGVHTHVGNTGQGTVATGLSYSVDPIRPTLESTHVHYGAGETDTVLKHGETALVTFTFSEAVTDFGLDDVLMVHGMHDGTLSQLASTGDGRVWTATLSAPTSEVTSSNNSFQVNLAGVNDLAGNAGEGQASTGVRYDIDTTPPVFDSATVTGDQLVVRYTEANSLDGTALTGSAGFTVRSATDTAIPVNSAVPNAAAKTVTLTLDRAVASDEVLSVSYAKPESGHGVQDAAGNAAASFRAMSVDNHTPAPTGLTDKDSDSIPGSVEDQTPGIADPAGAAAVAGDGNGDGIQDSAQAAVTSTRLVLSPSEASQPEDAASTPVTLVAGSQDGKLDPDSDARITRLEQEDAPAQLPQGMEMPLGLLSSEATLDSGHWPQLTGSSSEKFSLYVDPALGVNGYWAKDGTGTWVNLASSPYGGKMALEGGQLRLDYEISDGGPFDADGQANGVITAPGAAAQMPLSLVGQAPDAADGFWF
ncbi:Ig-like domain-containing protein [Verminephrobacter aporrectodeae]|uniref:Ig-like domain-containing protein n=3 Tax=Verminephrobacter aporrectodeae TaxID=1110389 RepID=UPI002244198C|nr:Ig-like domain-containing protein [Verminephrobacter aporrectodeae]